MEKQIKAVVAGIVGRSRSTRQGEFFSRTFWKKHKKKGFIKIKKINVFIDNALWHMVKRHVQN